MRAQRAAGAHKTAQRIALVLLAASAGSMPSLQPLIVGSLLDAGHVSLHQLGHVAAIEALSMAAAVLLAPSLPLLRDFGRTAAMALLVMIAANVATGFSHGGAVIACRAVAGLGEGLLLWIFVGAITREPDPGRIFAVYVTVLAAWGFLLSSLISHWLAPALGPRGPYLAFAAINIALLPFCRLVPAPAPPSPSPSPPDGPRGALPPAGLVGLGGVALFLCGIMAFWSYAVPLIRETTSTGLAMETVVPFVIGVHILGGLVAALTSRFPPVLACTLGPLALTLCMAAVVLVDSLAVQYLALLLFSFLWMFVPPFQLPLLLAIDPTARAAASIAGGHLIGLAAGPFLASLAVTRASVQGVLIVAAACLIAAASMPLLALALARRRPF